MAQSIRSCHNASYGRKGESRKEGKGDEGCAACGTTTLCSLVHVAATSISEQAGCATCVPPLGASRILCDEIYA